MKKSRKPSVLVSRRFSCPDSLNLKPLKPISSIKSDKEDRPRLIENNKDVTPLPLIRRDLPSIEDINAASDDENEYDSDSSGPGNLGMPWIPKLMSDIMENGKHTSFSRALHFNVPPHAYAIQCSAISTAKSSKSLRNMRDRIPLYETSADSGIGYSCNSDTSNLQVSSRTFEVATSQTNDSPKDTHEQEVQSINVVTTSVGVSTVDPEIQDSGCNCSDAENAKDTEDTDNIEKQIKDIVDAITWRMNLC